MKRALIDGNIFENNWAHAQNGFAILFTVRNQDGTAPWSAVEDVTFSRNILKNTASGINTHGSDNLQTSQQTKRLVIQDNIFMNVNPSQFDGDGHMLQFVGDGIPVSGLDISHNTMIHGGSIDEGNQSCLILDNDRLRPTGDKVVFRDNICGYGLYGYFGGGAGSGSSALNTYFTDLTFAKNVLVGNERVQTLPGSYPAGTLFSPSVGDVGFVNPIAGDYRLSASSPYKNAGFDGKDIGADVAATYALTAKVPSGN